MIYLGKQGSFTTREGLKIAYLSGLQSNDLGNAGDCNYSPANLQALEANLGWGDPRYQGVDILLTADWPKGITNLTTQ